MQVFEFDQNRLHNDFADLLKDFLVDGYANGRFELEQVKQIATTFVTNPTLINTPDQTTTDPSLKQAFLTLLKHAQIIQIRLYTTSLLSHLSTPQELSSLQPTLQSLLDTINLPLYSETQP